MMDLEFSIINREVMNQMSICRENAKIELQDEALRDGLQMESRIFTLEEKLDLFQMLEKAGIRRIQVGSFVHPRAVPQMADTEELIRAIGARDDVIVSALVLNRKGLERALKCGVRHVCMSVSVSDAHSRRNIRRSAAEALETMVQLIDHALASVLSVRAGLQCVFGCVYEGDISEDVVLRAAERMIRAGAEEICLADTMGMATPCSIRQVVRRLSSEVPEARISLHLHDTRGLGLANMFSGYEAGVRSFDSSVGGLGGCPFVQGAAGNVPTEDAVHMFEAMGMRTGIDLEAICVAVDFLEEKLGRRLPGRMRRVLEQRIGCDNIE